MTAGSGRPPLRTPALEQWWRELTAGKRTPTTFDPLWRAACAEYAALEAASAGLHHSAADYQAEARAIIRRAARKQTR